MSRQICTCSYVRRDTLVRVPWRIYICAMTSHSVHMTAAEGVVGRRALLSEVLAAGVVVAATAPVSAKVKKAKSGAWAAHEVCIALTHTLSLAHTHTLALALSVYHARSLTHTHALTLSPLSHTRSLSLLVSLPLSLSSALSHVHSQTHTRTHTEILAAFVSLSLFLSSLSPSLSFSLLPLCPLSLSLSPSIIQSRLVSHTQFYTLGKSCNTYE